MRPAAAAALAGLAAHGGPAATWLPGLRRGRRRRRPSPPPGAPPATT